MDQALLMWLFGAAFASIMTLALLFLGHIKECRDTRAALATLAAQNAVILREIGDHDSGIRGNLHDLRNGWSGPLLWVQRQMEKE